MQERIEAYRRPRVPPILPSMGRVIITVIGAECAVIGKLDALAGELPKAFVVLKAGQSATAEELIEFCAGRISPYKRIREVEFIDEIPKTPVGKLLRRILRDRERSK